MSQPSLLDPSFTPQSADPRPAWAGVARIVIDSPLPHLDRPFDYGIPAKLAEATQVGSRVSVAFAGRNVEGFVLDIASVSGHSELKPVRRVIGNVPVLTPEVRAFCEVLAQRYAGGLADVLRLAIPPRHATVEREVLEDPPTAPPLPIDVDTAPAEWAPYVAGEAFIRRLAAGESPRAVWTALPSRKVDTPEWCHAVAAATRVTLSRGRGVLVVVPTATEVAQVGAALDFAEIDHTVLTAELGPSIRYKNFLHALLGGSNVVVGTRAAIYAPVKNLGLVVCWDEVHDAHNEPRAPYPHSREALALRATTAGSAALFGGFARSPQAQRFVETGWAHHLGPERSTIRARVPRVRVADDHDRQREGAVGQARIPSFAWTRIKAALTRGPVLIQVPRRGYAPSIRCATCHVLARCQDCHGTLAVGASMIPACTWCGKDTKGWVCPTCQATTWKATQIGAGRTAEELGRAFPNVPIRVSGAAAARLDTVPAKPALIVATPGAEPAAEGGYELVALLDGSFLTDLPRLDAPISALHRWMRAAALSAGEVILLGDPLPAPAQALVRWDPVGYARRELLEWDDLGFPPTRTVVSITGERPDVTAFPRYLPAESAYTLLGPVAVAGAVTGPAEDELKIAFQSSKARLLVTAPASSHVELTDAIRSAIRTRSARHDGQALKVRVNPIDEL